MFLFVDMRWLKSQMFELLADRLRMQDFADETNPAVAALLLRITAGLVGFTRLHMGAL